MKRLVLALALLVAAPAAMAVDPSMSRADMIVMCGETAKKVDGWFDEHEKGWRDYQRRAYANNAALYDQLNPEKNALLDQYRALRELERQYIARCVSVMGPREAHKSLFEQ